MVWGVEHGAVIEVADHTQLRQFWRLLGDWLTRSFVGTIIVKKPLTPSQLGRLSEDLYALVQRGSELAQARSGVAELERMFDLEDPRQE